MEKLNDVSGMIAFFSFRIKVLCGCK